MPLLSVGQRRLQPDSAKALTLGAGAALEVQVPNHHILTPNLHYNYYYPKSKYLIIGYLEVTAPQSWKLKPLGPTKKDLRQPLTGKQEMKEWKTTWKYVKGLYRNCYKDLLLHPSLAS